MLPAFNFLTFNNTNNEEIQIKSAKNVKYLGIYIESNLLWNHQVEYVTQKLRGLIFKFKNLGNIIKIHDLISFYKALVESIIRYGIIGLGGVRDSYLTPLENI